MRLLIVDDEVIIREGISKVVPWKENGYELLEPVSSAEKALEIIQEEPPDIILTDIRMNEKSGLDIAAYVDKHELTIEVIILTGHDAFVYAQEALRQGVSDYLLKTSSPDEILKAVEKAKTRLITTKKHDLWKQGEQDRLLSELIKRIIQKQANLDEVQRIYEVMPEIQVSPVQVLILECSYPSEQLTKYEELWNTYLDGKWLSLSGETVILVRRNRCLEDEYVFQMAIRRIYQALQKPVYVGNVVSSLNYLSTTYEQAKSLSLYKWILPEFQMLRREDIEIRAGIQHTEKMDENGDKLLKAMNTGQFKEVEYWLDDVVSWLFTHPQATPGSIQLYIDALFINLLRFVNSIATSQDKKTFNYRSIPSPAEWFPSPMELLSPSFQEVFNNYQQVAKKEYNFVKMAIHYMEDSLGQALSLNEVANYVHVHPHYLSEMLREKTGKSYVELITELRIEKAKELLAHTTAKIRDVSIAIGYTDWKYFTSKFKKYTGMTPSQYRKSQ